MLRQFVLLSIEEEEEEVEENQKHKHLVFLCAGTGKHSHMLFTAI